MVGVDVGIGIGVGSASRCKSVNKVLLFILVIQKSSIYKLMVQFEFVVKVTTLYTTVMSTTCTLDCTARHYTSYGVLLLRNDNNFYTPNSSQRSLSLAAAARAAFRC